MNEIVEGDVLTVLPTLESNFFDLIIADPPYCIGKNFGTTVWKDFQSWFKWCKDWLQECYRVLKPEGSIFVYSSHKYVGYLQTYLYSLNLHYQRMIIWYYENGLSRQKLSPITMYEPILWFSKSKKYYYKPIREPYKSTERLKYAVTKNGKKWFPNPEGKHGGDVWNIPTLASKRFEKEKVNHPTQKPLKICRKIVEHFSPIGAKVLVPFSGSGSECVACKELQRNFLGIETNPEYVALAEKRLKEGLLSFL